MQKSMDKKSATNLLIEHLPASHADTSTQPFNIIYEFIKLIYKGSDIKKLFKIIDEVTKIDMEKFFKNKKDDEIADEFASTKANSNYTFEQSVYSALKHCGYGELMEPIIWHMVLLDILNTKFYDLTVDKPVEEAVTDALKRNSDNRLDFLFSQAKPYEFKTVGGALYEYSKRIFKDLPETRNTNPDQKQLMSRIFACFLKVAFYKMRQVVTHESYEDDGNYHKKYKKAISSFSRYFYIDSDDYHSEYVKSNTNDMADYLFSTGELETLFGVDNYANLEYFCFKSDYSSYARGRNKWIGSFDFLYYLNTIKPLEQQYKEDKDKFIQNFFPGKKSCWTNKQTSVDHIESILAYFNDEELLKEAKDYLISYFEIEDKYIGHLDENIQSGKKRIREMNEDKKIDQARFYFYDIIRRFTDSRYSNALVERVSAMLCRNGNSFIDNQKNNQNGYDNELMQNSSIIKDSNDIVGNNPESKKTEGNFQNPSIQCEIVQGTNLNEDINHAYITAEKNSLNNQIKTENNGATKTQAESETKNGKKNWFFRAVDVIISFFCSIGNKICNLFCGQQKKIDNVGPENNSTFPNFNNIESQNSIIPKSNDQIPKNEEIFHSS